MNKSDILLQLKNNLFKNEINDFWIDKNLRIYERKLKDVYQELEFTDFKDIKKLYKENEQKIKELEIKINLEFKDKKMDNPLVYNKNILYNYIYSFLLKYYLDKVNIEKLKKERLKIFNEVTNSNYLKNNIGVDLKPFLIALEDNLQIELKTLKKRYYFILFRNSEEYQLLNKYNEEFNGEKLKVLKKIVNPVFVRKIGRFLTGSILCPKNVQVKYYEDNYKQIKILVDNKPIKEWMHFKLNNPI